MNVLKIKNGLFLCYFVLKMLYVLTPLLPKIALYNGKEVPK